MDSEKLRLGLLAAAACLAGCAGSPPSGAEPPEGDIEERLEYRREAAGKKPFERVPEPVVGPATGDQAPPQDLLERILADAADQARSSPELVRVVSATAVVWPDGSLGCPEPGREYTPEPVPGYHVHVSAAGRSLDYRADRRGNFFVCGPSRLRRPGPAE